MTTDPELIEALNTIPITLPNGNSYDVDLGESLTSEDIPGEITFFGKLLGASEKQKILSEATYRQWRAVTTRSVLAKDPKKAEWKLRADIESETRFIDLKQEMASAESACAVIRTHINALLVIAGHANATSPLHPPHVARRR